MRKVKFSTYQTGGTTNEFVGHFHKWVVVEDTACAIVEDEDSKIHLVNYEMITFIDKPAEENQHVLRLLAKWDSDGVPEPRTS